MTTATVTWTLPPKRPFAVDFLHSIISLSVDGGANFTDIATILPGDVQQAVSGELSAGDWIAKGILFDINGKASVPAEAQFQIGDIAAPDALENLVVTLS